MIEVLEALWRQVDVALISERARDRLRRLAAFVPLTRGGFSIECHLGRVDRADLVVRVMRGEVTTLLETESELLAPARRFARVWPHPDLQRVPYVDLELDIVNEPAPCIVGATIEPSFAEGIGRMRAARPSAEAGFEQAVRFLSATDEAILRDVRAHVHRCFRALPSDGFIAHVASMNGLARGGSNVVRLIASLPERNLRDYLRDVGWQGSIDAFANVTRAYTHGARVDVDLDVTHLGVAPSSAFYCTFWKPHEEGSRVRRLTERLETDGVIDAAEARAVRELRVESAAPFTMTIKLKYGDGGALEAKLYLSLMRLHDAS